MLCCGLDYITTSLTALERSEGTHGNGSVHITLDNTTYTLVAMCSHVYGIMYVGCAFYAHHMSYGCGATM